MPLRRIQNWRRAPLSAIIPFKISGLEPRISGASATRSAPNKGQIMSRMPNVPASVSAPQTGKAASAPAPAAASRPRRGIPHLSGTPAGWRFQMRVPRHLRKFSFLAAGDSIVRISLGAMPVRRAKTLGRRCALLCSLVFELAAKELSGTMAKSDLETSEADLLKHVIDACQQAIGKALTSPSEALGIAMGLDSALATLKLVASEAAKGEAGAAHIIEASESLTRGALSNVLALAQDPQKAMAALQAVPTVAPPLPASSVVPARPASTAPTFGEVSQAYIDMRIGIDGADHPEIAYLFLRRQTFLEIVGDRAIDQYSHKDLQDYVTAMRCWPGNATKRAEMAGRSVKEILAANADLHLMPMAEKTFKSYVSHIRTMLRYQMNDRHYQDPFVGAKPRYPKTAAPPRARQEIPANVLQRSFELGIASGCIDQAMMPPLASLTARRLGLLTYLRGSDIREKGGIMIADIQGIVQVNGIWRRIPYKTGESVGFFVLHEFFRDIGWTAWAMAQGDNWLFPQLHRYPDPAKQASRLMNRLLVSAGAAGNNVEVFHSLRGDGITGLRRVGEIHDRTAKLQAGHVLDGEHENYGRKDLLHEECVAIATRPLPKDVKWGMFKGLDFDALAKGRRKSGRPRKAK